MDDTIDSPKSNQEDGELLEQKTTITDNKRTANDSAIDESNSKRPKTDCWIYSINDDDPKNDDKKDDERSLDEGEIIDDDDDDNNFCNNNQKLQQNDEIISNYSDWSDGEDDLLKADGQQDLKDENDSNGMNNDKDDNDLEAISDDDDDMINQSMTNEPKSMNDENIESSSSLKGQNNENSNQQQDEESREISLIETLNIDWKSLINDTDDDDNNDRTSNKDCFSTNDKNDNNIGEENMKRLRMKKFRERNSVFTMLNRIGFSRKFAGEELSMKIEKILSEKLQDQYRPNHSNFITS